MKQYFGIDIGGTAVKLGIVDETGRVLLKGEESVSFDGYQTPVLTTVRKAAKEFLTTNSIPVESLAGIGVSATGQIDSRKGIVAGTCGNFPNYIGSPIKSALEEDFGLPVTVANDANCMTLGEVWVGAAQGYTDVIGVTLGTGVGGGILTGGHLLEGARGLGGELGHYRTHALDGVDCTCGAKGCWERYAATTALVRAAQEKDPAWKDGRAIFAAASFASNIISSTMHSLLPRSRATTSTQTPSSLMTRAPSAVSSSGAPRRLRSRRRISHSSFITGIMCLTSLYFSSSSGEAVPARISLTSL